MIIHQIEQTHFSDSEALIIQFILNKGMDIKNMTTKEIAEATFTSPSLLIRIAKKMGNLVSWVNLKKYDNDKVADIMGSHVMVFGLCLSAIAGINYVLKNRYPYIITITIIVMAVATEFGAYYRICKYAKLED